MISKTDLIDRVASQTSLSRAQATRAVNAVFDTITETLSQGEEVRLPGFGVFRVSQRKERMGRNPRTGEAMLVPGGPRPAFSPSSKLTEVVRGKGKMAA